MLKAALSITGVENIGVPPLTRNDLTLISDDLKAIPDGLEVIPDALKVIPDGLRVISDGLKVISDDLSSFSLVVFLKIIEIGRYSRSTRYKLHE
jgi:hypothetical protein